MSTPWPYKTDADLRAAGYVFESTSRCSGENCRRQIEWWRTPRQKRMPLDPGTMEPHWSTCLDRDEFQTPTPMITERELTQRLNAIVEVSPILRPDTLPMARNVVHRLIPAIMQIIREEVRAAKATGTPQE